MFVDGDTVCFETKTLPSDYNINIGRVLGGRFIVPILVKIKFPNGCVVPS